MLSQVEQNLGRKPQAASADAGYWSEANATDESVAGIDLHIATGRDKREQAIETVSEPPPVLATAKEAMRHKLRTEAGRSIYKMRKAIVEPVFGQIKEQRSFRRFSLRVWTMFAVSGNWCAWRPICSSCSAPDGLHRPPEQRERPFQRIGTGHDPKSHQKPHRK